MHMLEPFVAAEPVWLAGRTEEVNVRTGFQAAFASPQGASVVLRITGSTLYRVYVNGSFVSYGPARAAHGHVRVDELDLGQYVSEGVNVLSVEVAGYNCFSYYTLKLPSFLQAEIAVGGNIAAATGRHGSFKGFELTGIIRKTMRYSFQRTFTEAYSLDHAAAEWYRAEAADGEPLMVVPLEVRYLPREVPLPEFRIVWASKLTEKGRIEKRMRSPDTPYRRQRFINDLPSHFTGFALDEIEVRPYERLQDMHFEPLGLSDEDMPLPDGSLEMDVREGEYVRFELPCNNTGFIACKIMAREDSEIYMIFDEKLIDGRFDIEYWQSLNVIRYELKAGLKPYRLETFESYGFKHIQLIVLKGSVRLEGIGLREYSYPNYGNADMTCSDERLNRIYAASIESYRQNTLDVFMDCPTRERAGWLCDSYFTAQSARFFSGETIVEKVMLENYVQADEFPYLPKGMLPMCYPADHPNGNYIPQWALWYIIELEDYFRRSKQADASAFRKLCFGILRSLEQYRNGDGLLEKLDGWNFIEWSEANKWVHDVNYPSNMLYAKALALVGSWYGDEALVREARLIRRTIVEQSFDGRFFSDHAVRDGNGALRRAEHKSEVCQYSAFFFDVADVSDETFRALQQSLLHEFGPERKRRGGWPEVAHANAFIGNYMRMELLLSWGRYGQVLEEAKAYFYPMAERTGTLWEHDNIRSGSLNHGFASVIGVYLIRCLLGVQELDGDDGAIMFDLDRLPTCSASGRIGTAAGAIHITRETSGERTRLEVRLPRGLRCEWQHGIVPDFVDLKLMYE